MLIKKVKIYKLLHSIIYSLYMFAPTHFVITAIANIYWYCVDSMRYSIHLAICFIFLLPLNCNNNFFSFAVKRFSTFQWRFRCQIAYKILVIFYFSLPPFFFLPIHSMFYVCDFQVTFGSSSLFLFLSLSLPCWYLLQSKMPPKHLRYNLYIYFIANMYEHSRSDNIWNWNRWFFPFRSLSLARWESFVCCAFFVLKFHLFFVSFFFQVCVCVWSVHSTINLFNHIYSLAVKYFKSCWILQHVFFEW